MRKSFWCTYSVNIVVLCINNWSILTTKKFFSRLIPTQWRNRNSRAHTNFTWWEKEVYTFMCIFLVTSSILKTVELVLTVAINCPKIATSNSLFGNSVQDALTDVTHSVVNCLLHFSHTHIQRKEKRKPHFFPVRQSDDGWRWPHKALHYLLDSYLGVY